MHENKNIHEKLRDSLKHARTYASDNVSVSVYHNDDNSIELEIELYNSNIRLSVFDYHGGDTIDDFIFDSNRLTADERSEIIALLVD